MQHNTPFTVAGMSSSTSTVHNPTQWGSSSTNTAFGDSLSQSRSHYQSGYLLSAQQNQNSPPGNQRVDEVPVVPTKAKLNQGLTGRSTNEFGMESMFQSSRRQQNYADEDAPPISSVDDIPNEVYQSSKSRYQPRSSTLFESKRHNKAPNSAMSSSKQREPLYIVVFGYPEDKYSVTVEYFKSLGDSTEADPHAEIANCFRIGYNDPADAMRAVRKNGEVLGGSWMVGAKWADQAQAEMVLGQGNFRAMNFGDSATPALPPNSNDAGNAMAVDEPNPYSPSPIRQNGSPRVGTPIRLEPSSSAFKRPIVGAKPAAPVSMWGSPANASANNGGGGASVQVAQTVTPQRPKSVIGQVSDLIFGW